jgi:hypothetical protein
MGEKSSLDDNRGPSTGTVEIIVAVLLIGFGAVVMWDSARIGAGWASDGPQAGYFPFYIGLIIALASGITLTQAIARRRRGDKKQGAVFVTLPQLRLVLSVLIPTAVFVLVIPLLGIYVSAAIFICLFMWRLGGYPFQKSVPVALGMPIVAFITFEKWFLVPLPKGPLEAMLGY